MHVQRLREWQFEDVTRFYDERDSILYALGLGLGINYDDPAELRFVTEGGLRTLPTMAAVVAKLQIRDCLLGVGADVVRAVHGEQRSAFDRPLPPSGRVVGRGRVSGIWDKGSGRGTLVEFEQEVFDAESDARIACLRNLTFLRGDGGQGGDAGDPPRIEPVPETEPEIVVDIPTSPQAALIYRLSGDRNPLHSDPRVARQAGYPRPILHGYCTYGVAGWAIIRTCLGGDPERLTGLDCRFSAPVHPGEMLRAEIWPGAQTIRFRVRIPGRDVIALAAGTAIVRS